MGVLSEIVVDKRGRFRDEAVVSWTVRIATLVVDHRRDVRCALTE